MNDRITELLPLLRCPRTHRALHYDNGRLISEGGEEYPIVNGKPVLVRIIQRHHLVSPPADHTSQNQKRYVVEERCSSSPKRCLHLGSGNIPCADPRVISFDVLPCDNVDIVGEAEELPFTDDVFDLVDSGAVFEHLWNPLQSIKEVKRVTAPNGFNLIDTAFLQSYHGFPAHYFNMTPLAAESFLVDDFVLEDSHVPGSATPVKTFTDFSDRFLGVLPENKCRDIKDMTLRDLLKAMKDDVAFAEQLLQEFSEYATRTLGASFVIASRKPVGWKATHSLWENDPALAEKSQVARREYYELRMTVITRHHEVLMYKRLCHEKGTQLTGAPHDPAPVGDLLAGCKPADILSLDAVTSANNGLREVERDLRRRRDEWIKLYTAPTSSGS
jgi:SAM-dependent methyltransferase